MKKFLIALITLVLLVAVSAVAFATVTGSPMPVAVYMYQDGVWVNPPSTDLGLHAKAFTFGPRGGMCDKEVWTENITTHVSVSQWINYYFGGTRWDWQVRKPGTFAADCIEFSIQSNDDVNVSFSGFDNLAPLVHQGATPINVYYSYSPQGSVPSDTPPTEGWVSAQQLNDVRFTLPYDQISSGLTKKLWNKIEILDTTRACDYENTGVVTLTLTDVKYFINPATGDYNGLNPTSNPL